MFGSVHSVCSVVVNGGAPWSAAGSPRARRRSGGAIVQGRARLDEVTARAGVDGAADVRFLAEVAEHDDRDVARLRRLLQAVRTSKPSGFGIITSSENQVRPVPAPSQRRPARRPRRRRPRSPSSSASPRRPSAECDRLPPSRIQDGSLTPPTPRSDAPRVRRFPAATGWT